MLKSIDAELAAANERHRVTWHARTDVTMEQRTEMLAYIARRRWLKFREGCYVSHLNFRHDISDAIGRHLSWEEEYPEIGPFDADGLATIPHYGVVDNTDQFIEKVAKQLEADTERTFVAYLTHIAKDPENAGKGGGWRWHKWGPYLGTGKPEYEYLDDEKGFDDGVFVFGICQIAGPIIKSPSTLRLEAHMARLHQEAAEKKAKEST